MSLYYECHITVAPVFGANLEQFKAICEPHGFKVAKLLMQKDLSDSKKDSFCTGHSQSYLDLYSRMYELILTLKAAGFVVWRYKIEDCMLDSRHYDSLGLLEAV